MTSYSIWRDIIKIYVIKIAHSFGILIYKDPDCDDGHACHDQRCPHQTTQCHSTCQKCQIDTFHAYEQHLMLIFSIFFAVKMQLCCCAQLRYTKTTTRIDSITLWSKYSESHSNETSETLDPTQLVGIMTLRFGEQRWAAVHPRLL